MTIVPNIFLFTGLSGAGKTTLAQRFSDDLRRAGQRVELLDGDVVRRDLCHDLGFSKADRIENVRRLGEAAIERVQAGADTAIIAAIAPYRSSRDALQRRMAALGINYCEVFVDCPLDEVIKRDPKGLYAKALRGEIQNFTGVSDPYEPPEAPNIWLPTHELSIDESLNALHVFHEGRLGDDRCQT